jgi:four helix bundle protein
MATIQRFEDLEIWQKARTLCNEIYTIINSEPFSKDFKLKEQINASSGSVMDNIAEGFERDGKQEFKQFLSISKGSCGEVRSQLYRAFDRKYIYPEKFEQLKTLTEEISKQLSNFIKYLNNTTIKGIKHKT